MSWVEEQTMRAWRIWGEAFSMHTTCSRCNNQRYCRGKRRGRMLCIFCFDEVIKR